ncbi:MULTISPECIES: TonB-dependent receptor [unclassified Polaribacter]|uniref:TonB-dependent receptor n=1 Tax=unclassified Polaribacter TaxID=196858 RepID=UPI0011BFD331|nr:MULTISPECIES: TonB-dependent receptor [unclassified Polaribacter]TXD53327.1 TonB-dependent receptor [Polaribacter sp. IC063]TXD57166.1 TonB-dependent receptor [Polaribacter sp. IC066]
MKRSFLIFLMLFGFLSVVAQVKPKEKVAPTATRDTVKTEIVEVITTYNPKIADANKIKKNPIIQFINQSKKKKLGYTIFSAPVASTFIPKSGVVKGIDVGVKERVYDNYIAAGFGNYTSPYAEAFIHQYTRFQSEFGVSAKYIASLDNIENTVLDSDFSSFTTSLFYKKEERYFDWKVVLNTERDNYNWYGLKPATFSDLTIGNIQENQTYNHFNIAGELDFLDAYVDKSNLSLSYFTDALNSSEFLINFDTDLDVPLNFISRNLNSLQVKTSLELLTGKFESDYATQNELNYTMFTAKVNPEYNTTFKGFSLKLGAKLFASFDAENSVNHFLAYPDIKIQKAIIEEHLTMYAGVFGDFHTNTYKGFTEENPFISPTQFITQTAERYNAFLGFNGVFNNDFSFNISASMRDEQDKALFVVNNSKSNGISNFASGTELKGYEYGNSFSVVYDDVKTTSIFAELAYDVTKRVTLSTYIQFDNFKMTTQSEAWNLPTIQTALLGAYKSNKWFATTTIFYIGERKDVLYASTYPSSTNGIQDVNSFVDVNLNGGYHFNDKFSAFLRLNNILNTNYQRFANFNVQGFQALGGITYKFDF